MDLIEQQITVDGARLWCRTTGSGDALVLVHGGWTDHGSWAQVAPALAGSFTVVTHDRRGHSRSRVTPGADESRRAHEDDVAALVEALDLGAVHLAGNSYGAAIALGVAARYPALVRSVIAHEPPLLDVGGPHAEATGILQGVADLLRSGDVEAAIERFVDGVLGAGTWPLLPEELQRTMVANAPTYVAMIDAPGWASLDAGDLAGLATPILLTDGARSPAWLPAIVAEVAALLPGAARHTFPTAGHMPQVTHPDEYVEVVKRFAAHGTGALHSLP